MANIPQEPGAALRNILPMFRDDPPTGGGCPSCGRHNPRTARTCAACGFTLIEAGKRRSLLRRLLRR